MQCGIKKYKQTKIPLNTKDLFFIFVMYYHDLIGHYKILIVQTSLPVFVMMYKQGENKESTIAIDEILPGTLTKPANTHVFFLAPFVN